MSNNSSNTCNIKNKSIASLNEVYKLIIRGENFRGSLELTVKDAENEKVQKIYSICRNGYRRYLYRGIADTEFAEVALEAAE